MLPKNTLRDKRMERLKIFETDEIMGGIGGNVTTAWGSLVERRGLLVGAASGSSVTASGAQGTSEVQGTSGGAQGTNGALGTNGVLRQVDWTKPLPDALRTARAISGKKRVVHGTKVKAKREGMVQGKRKAKVS